MLAETTQFFGFFFFNQSQISCETARHFKVKNTHCLQSCYLTLAEDCWGLVSRTMEQSSTFMPHTRHIMVFPDVCLPLGSLCLCPYGQLWADVCLQEIYLLAWLLTSLKPRYYKVTIPDTRLSCQREKQSPVCLSPVTSNTP